MHGELLTLYTGVGIHLYLKIFMVALMNCEDRGPYIDIGCSELFIMWKYNIMYLHVFHGTNRQNVISGCLCYTPTVCEFTIILVVAHLFEFLQE